MRIEGEAIILSRKKASEGSALVSFLCKEYGIKHGYCKISSRNSSHSEIGSLIRYNAILKNNSRYLNITKLELIKSYTLSFIDNTKEFYKILYVINLADHILKDNQGDTEIFSIINNFCDSLPSSDENLIKLELKLLALSGYGLDLNRCSASNTRNNLAYISPKTGGALSFEYGNKFSDKLFKLPQWLLDGSKPTKEDLDYTSKITHFFVNYIHSFIFMY